MYYNQAELKASMPDDFPSTKKQLLSLARNRGELLLTDQGRYKAWGPYWWIMKTFLRRYYPSLRPWFMKNSRDPELEVELPCFEEDPDGFSTTLWAAERYGQSGLQDQLAELPGELHLITIPEEGPVLYRLQDVDAAWQLDLFDQAAIDPARNRNMDKIVASSPGTWRREGDKSLESGDMDRAVWAYRRMVAAARTEDEQGEAWIRLAQCLVKAGKPEMAVFCYMNLQGLEGMNWIWGESGRIYLEAGIHHRAFECFRHACQLMPDNPEYLWGYQQTLKHLVIPARLDLAGA